MIDFADYSWLVESSDAAAWLERIATDPRSELAQLAALRKELPAERARLIVAQGELRRRAAAKFGALAARMFFLSQQLEQATDLAIARYKAARFAELRRPRVADYCCGIGGDLMALAEVTPVTGYDLSSVACLVAQANLRAVVPAAAADQPNVVCGDVNDFPPASDLPWHIDPDRRAHGRRFVQIAAYSPGADLIDRWLGTAPHAAVKLASAVDPPPHWHSQAELEWISTGRECRQCIAWFGELAGARGLRRATVLLAGQGEQDASSCGTITGVARRDCPSSNEPRTYVFDPDPAVLAADLLGELAARHGLSTLGAGGAYLTGDQPVDDALLAAFIVDDCLPLRVETIAKHLAAQNIGQVEIKQRGVSLNPDQLRRQLKPRGDNAATLIFTRIAKRRVALIARRLARDLQG